MQELLLNTKVVARNRVSFNNDPNGLCYWQVKWHLFYQAYPPEDSRQHWGHIISDDLIYWEDLPYAIYPNPEKAVYSGSTFVEKDIAWQSGSRRCIAL